MKHLLQVILIDCFDSFTYNLVHYLEPFSQVNVIRVNKIKLCDIEKYDAIVLSPGPGLPSDYPILKKNYNNNPYSIVWSMPWTSGYC